MCIRDSRDPVRVAYAVRDVDTGEAVLGGEVSVGGDSVGHAGWLDEAPGRQRCLDIRWTADGAPGRSHQVTGPPPFDLDRFAAWYAALGLPLPDGT